MGRFMIVVVFVCLSKELHCVGNREGILHFYMYYQPVVCNICVVKKMWQSVILNIYIYMYNYCLSVGGFQYMYGEKGMCVTLLQGRPRIMSSTL